MRWLDILSCWLTKECDIVTLFTIPTDTCIDYYVRTLSVHMYIGAHLASEVSNDMKLTALPAPLALAFVVSTRRTNPLVNFDL